MSLYNLIEYSDHYSKTSGGLCQYYRDEPNPTLTNSESFKYKVKITGKTPADGKKKDVKIEVPIKYLSNFWRTLEVPLINCEINHIITRSSTFVITNSTNEGTFAVTNTRLFAQVVNL